MSPICTNSVPVAQSDANALDANALDANASDADELDANALDVYILAFRILGDMLKEWPSRSELTRPQKSKKT